MRKKENYSDMYVLYSRTLPELEKFDWYGSEGKVWLKNIKLSPIVLKHWYVNDGYYHKSNAADHIGISISNEVGNIDKINNYFSNVGLPTPSNYTTTKQSKNDNLKCDLQFTKSDSKILWDYMGKPLPDFEYKWPR